MTDHVVRERNYPRILKCFQLTTLWATLLDAHTTVDSIAIGVDVTIRAHQHVIIRWCETSLCLRSKPKGNFAPRWVDCGFSQKYVQEASLHMPKNPYKVRIDTIDRIKHSSKDTTNVLQVWWISPLSIVHHGIWTGWCALSIWEAVDSKSKYVVKARTWRAIHIELCVRQMISRFPDIGCHHRCLGGRDLAGKIEKSDDH